ncbi:hypothetical protein EMGBS15_08740 [Filimonas sp.]|jgi:hypothetical protein|nr:hypothetical protein EMGBS15_08740 [Filimonas sp.]
MNCRENRKQYVKVKDFAFHPGILLFRRLFYQFRESGFAEATEKKFPALIYNARWYYICA